MKTIDSYNFKSKRALIRVDFNVPQNENLEVTDVTRIKAVKPTIDKIINEGGKVILMAHLGRPKGIIQDKFSLKHIVKEVENILNLKVIFSNEVIGNEVVEKTKNIKENEILLLENLRFYSGEEKGGEEFALELSKLGDIYVNDAFGAAHRSHASTTIIAKYFKEKCFGYLMANEIENINKVIQKGKKPITAIIGGAKVSSKISIIENILPVIDNLIIGGGMIFTFIKSKGGKIGNSLVENDYLETALKIVEKAKEFNVNIIIPKDVVAADNFSNDANTIKCLSNEIPDGWIGLDVAEESIKEIEQVIINSQTILWNGPLGVFELENFANGTKKLGEAIALATEKGAFSLVGGGDSVAAAKKFNIADKTSFVSTGGGAMLEYLEGKLLPGVEVILNQ